MLELNFDETIKADIQDLFSRLPVMTLRQFLRSLQLITGMQGELLTEAYKRLASKGRILVSKNNYVTTKNSYDIVSDDPIAPRDGGIVRLGDLQVKDYFKQCIQCYNVILDLYPISKDFYLERDLFHIAFADMEKDRLFEVIRIPQGKERLYQALIVSESSCYTGTYGKVIKEATRRIALVDSDAAAGEVPYCGFSHICKVDENDKRGFVVIEKRKDNLWKDALSV